MLPQGFKMPTDISKGNCFKDFPIIIIDFGFATRYLDDKGVHLKNE